LKTNGKIITVFGCGGDRDRIKRPVMAEVSERYSDLVIVTSDNPRTEDPNKIIDDIVKGFKNKNYIVEIDRKEAIKKAVLKAEKDDIILIAGKGHETYQILGTTKIHFDDREIAIEAIKELEEVK
ncbi:MAG: glutamate ligase domain-containing protein, partial [Cetobacterium sp.]